MKLVKTLITVSSISTSSGPSYGVYYNGKIYIVAQSANQLQVISNNSVIKTITLPSYPPAVPFKVTECNGDFYIVYQKGPEINSNGDVIKVFRLPNTGKFPEICSADGYVIVTASDGNKVYFIKNGIVHNVTVMPSPQGLAYDVATNVIYGISLKDFKIVYNFTLNESGMDTMTFVPPDEIAVATYDQQVFFLNATTGKVIAITTLPVGDAGINGYSQIVYIPYDGLVAISLAHNNDQVALINGSIVALVTVGNAPNGIVYDPQNHQLYVMDYASNEVSYFSPPPPQTTYSTTKIQSPSLLPYMTIIVVAIVIVVVGSLLIRGRKI
ncbi:YncE family protein [Stygiolobus azoricus]|uniref:YncE family protein n=1 Tax=Stygiolobus azoricus TaxID=41675 RepID=A0A650CPE6_9CREN|nr:hypothetical protein [Stygiolobus azoricus]QGR19709.1 hypothetical protein D1868_06675 [Stygiolobus azoricus]